MSLKAWTTTKPRCSSETGDRGYNLTAGRPNYARAIEALPRGDLRFENLLNALSRFSTTASMPAVSEAVREQCDIEADKLDSELSMVRPIGWAIPSIGFIGTVRGIGDALGQAYKAVGNVQVSLSLGVAFNSTFVALVLRSLCLLHQLQLTQERLVLRTQDMLTNNSSDIWQHPNEP